MAVGGIFSGNGTQSTIKESALNAKGFFREQISWSKFGEVFESTLIKISSIGELVDLTAEEVIMGNLQSCNIQIQDNALLVTSFNGKDQVYFRPADKDIFIKLLSSLIFWQGLKPQGVIYKKLDIKYDNRAKANEPENLLVCNCKIYGKIPKSKNIEIIEDAPTVSIYPDSNEAWFSAMVVLKSNGILELLCESDGSLIYSIDVKLLLRSEIREIDNSIFESSNYLFLGVIDKLRQHPLPSNLNNLNLNTSNGREISKEVPKLQKIILQFPYRIDVEDWVLALSSFAIREYVGLNYSNLLRFSRKINLGILDLALDNEIIGPDISIYAEISIWGTSWYRTSLVKDNKSPFFRESFDIDLPLITKSFRIIIKYTNNSFFANDDPIIGFTTLTNEHFTDKKLEIESRLPILDRNLNETGKICLSLFNQKNYILLPDNFNNFEKMILHTNHKHFLKFILEKSSVNDLERTSLILLDIFQALQKENYWFSALIDEEVLKLSNSSINPTRSPTTPHSTPNPNNGSNNLLNNLFRNNSFLTKSLDIYNLRIGHEYLEKVIGTFISKIVSNNESMEVDPLRIRVEDEDLKTKIIENNYTRLLKHVEYIWNMIFKTSNDLPEQIKQQLTLLRKKIELYTSDTTVTLNCITGFIFLRFFCPVILNPKLFSLTTNHQIGETKRSLTLISKILMTFANRSKFGTKDNYLIKFNTSFIEKHELELVEYLDKITGKKLDFSEKRLKLSSNLERSEFLFSSKNILKELPTNPYLIDKYLRFEQLVEILRTNNNNTKNDFKVDDYGTNLPNSKIPKNMSKGNELYKIGSLEFEKLIINSNDNTNINISTEKFQSNTDEGDYTVDDVTSTTITATNNSFDYEFGSEEFLKNLLGTSESEHIFNYLNEGSSLKDLIVESDRLYHKKERLLKKLSSYETIDSITDLDSYIDNLVDHTILDSNKNIVQINYYNTNNNLKFISNESTLSSLKIKFLADHQNALENHSNSHTASPTKRISQIIRSASISTLSSFTSKRNLASIINNNDINHTLDEKNDINDSSSTLDGGIGQLKRSQTKRAGFKRWLSKK